MSNIEPDQFTSNHVILGDDALAFRCSDDGDKFPWLTLPPSNAIVVQALTYFTLVEASLALGTLDPAKWTALTYLRWDFFGPPEGAAHAHHGLMSRAGEAGAPDFRMTFFSRNGAPLYRTHGRGVVFRNRDFAGWRAKNREEIMSLPAPDKFQYASARDAGVASDAERLVSPLVADGGAQAVDALLTGDNAFYPTHPYHGGSGDHVNSSHQADVVQQAAHLIAAAHKGPLHITGGEASFNRYIELNRPFRIALQADQSSATRMTFLLQQGGRDCTTFVLNLAE